MAKFNPIKAGTQALPYVVGGITIYEGYFIVTDTLPPLYPDPLYDFLKGLYKQVLEIIGVGAPADDNGNGDHENDDCGTKTCDATHHLDSSCECIANDTGGEDDGGDGDGDGDGDVTIPPVETLVVTLKTYPRSRTIYVQTTGLKPAEYTEVKVTMTTGGATAVKQGRAGLSGMSATAIAVPARGNGTVKVTGKTSAKFGTKAFTMTV